MYDLHLEAYVRQIIQPPRRLRKNVAFIRTLLSPVATLFSLFTLYRRAAILSATATGQVAVLEYNCNLIAGLPSGYIYITDSAAKDFTVLIPPSLSALKEQEIYNFVRRYKPSGKLFEIVRNI